ncbi:MAG: HdeD family acid-resistance protein [Gemmataceae bacterium]
MSLPLNPPPIPLDERPSLQRVWGLLLVLGLISVFVGLVAVGSTFVASLASVVVLGVLLLVAGVTELIHAIAVRNLKAFAIHLLSAALYLVAGLFIIEHPLQTMEVLTLFIAASLLVGGLLRVVFSFAVRFHSWSWVALHGVVDLVLGGMILAKWPESSLWVIGLFVGIDMLMNGWAWVILALTVKNHAPPAVA